MYNNNYISLYVSFEQFLDLKGYVIRTEQYGETFMGKNCDINGHYHNFKNIKHEIIFKHCYSSIDSLYDNISYTTKEITNNNKDLSEMKNFLLSLLKPHNILYIQEAFIDSIIDITTTNKIKTIFDWNCCIQQGNDLKTCKLKDLQILVNVRL